MKIEFEYENKYTELVQKIVLKKLKNLHCRVFLFGSRASGNYRFGSDFDIGINKLDSDTFLRMKYRILEELEESKVPWQVDIVNFDIVSDRFRKIAEKVIVEWKTD